MTTTRSVYINLPVQDLDKTKDFFSRLGFEFNTQFEDENATCMVLSEHGCVMLLKQEFFKTFTTRSIADAATIEAIVALSADSREDVDRLADLALEIGAAPANDPMDHGFMYARSFHDLDGHMWEVFWMDPDHIQQ